MVTVTGSYDAEGFATVAYTCDTEGCTDAVTDWFTKEVGYEMTCAMIWKIYGYSLTCDSRHACESGQIYVLRISL